MTSYYFVLGREPLLSAAEIIHTLTLKDYTLTGGILSVSLSEPPTDLINRLGGTIKIAEEIVSEADQTTALDLMVEELKKIDGKIHFGLSLYNCELSNNQTKDLLTTWGKELKKMLKDEGLSVRYVENRETILSSVTVEKNGLTKRGREFIIIETAKDTFSIAKTLTVQPFEAFSERDFGRPGRDDKSGMLPPKLALMAINLSRITKDQTLLDPFCGSGTIVTEALLQGFTKIIGSDVSSKAVEDSKQNIDYTRSKNADLLCDLNIFESDVRSLDKHIPANSVDAIITEPYLGKPLRGNEKPEALRDQTNELAELYLQAFTVFQKILKPGAKVIFIIPSFRTPNGWLRIDCAKSIEKIGFTIAPLLPTHDYLLYARPNQHVGREMWCFEKK